MLDRLASLFTAQENRLFQLHTTVKSEHELVLSSFTGAEGLSEDFGFRLELVCEDRNIKLKSALGQRATVEIRLESGGSRFINGVISGFSKRRSDDGTCHYSAVVGSWFSLLEQRHDARIFHEKTVADVVSDVFSRYPTLADYEFQLAKPLKVRSYVTQYRESDYHFVLRLLEDEGLYFYFVHTADSHRMIIGDDTTRFSALPEHPVIAYQPDIGMAEVGSIFEWTAARSLHSGALATQTFDYRQPRNRLPVHMKTLNQQGDAPTFELYDYMGHYTHQNYEEGEALLRRRIELLELGGKAFKGGSDCRALRVGHTFELQGHYEHDKGLADDRIFLPMSVHHSGMNNYLSHQSAQYSNTFECVRAKVPFRPALNRLRPTIMGPQTAVVVGPKGEEIYTDAMGRIKVQFHWDRYGQFNDQSSCWVRVVQPAASAGFGSIRIPRVGDEVVVEFLEGNPDRPLVTGSLYNASNSPPWELPANKTQSGMMTRSIKGQASQANFLRFEDKLGAEQLCIHAEREMLTEVEADYLQRVGGTRCVSVQGNHVETVRKSVNVTVEEGGYRVEAQEGAIHFTAATQITLEVGKSVLRLKQDGTIEVQGVTVNIEGAGVINLNA